MLDWQKTKGHQVWTKVRLDIEHYSNKSVNHSDDSEKKEHVSLVSYFLTLEIPPNSNTLMWQCQVNLNQSS